MTVITLWVRVWCNDNLRYCKYVCITTNQPDTKSNPNPNPATKQHALGSIQLRIMVTCPTYPEKFVGENVAVQFLLLSVVIVPHPVVHRPNPVTAPLFLLNSRILSHPPKRNIFNYLSDIYLLTKREFFEARYSHIVLKVPLNHNQSIIFLLKWLYQSPPPFL